MTPAGTNQPVKCGPVALDEDGAAFLCMGCGAKMWRTRDDLYGEPAHQGEPRWNAEYAALCKKIDDKRAR